MKIDMVWKYMVQPDR